MCMPPLQRPTRARVVKAEMFRCRQGLTLGAGRQPNAGKPLIQANPRAERSVAQRVAATN
jgi:hypothetical protein